jgi:hypothetical protein
MKNLRIEGMDLNIIKAIYDKSIANIILNGELLKSYNPVIPLPCIYPKECKSGYNRDTCTLMFTAAVFTIAKFWKQPRCPIIDESIKICTHEQWSFIQP